MLVYTRGLLEHNSKILLVLRQNSLFFNNFYGMVGGKVEANESITQALIREAYEEIGITITRKDFHFAHCLSFKTPENDHVLVLTFKINTWQGQIINKERQKCVELAWFSYNNLPKNIIPHHKLIIEKIKKSLPYSEYGWE